MSDEQTWIEKLQPGDEVAVWPSFGRVPRVETVGRVTATQIVIGACRFRKCNGWQIGPSAYNRSHIARLTDDLRFAADKKRLAERLRESADRAGMMTKEDVAKWHAFLDEEGAETK